jgi:hypothetical protein
MNAVKTVPDTLGTDHIPNAVTIAAMREGEAILRGEIPSAVIMDPTQYQTQGERI